MLGQKCFQNFERQYWYKIIIYFKNIQQNYKITFVIGTHAEAIKYEIFYAEHEDSDAARVSEETRLQKRKHPINTLRNDEADFNHLLGK